MVSEHGSSILLEFWSFGVYGNIKVNSIKFGSKSAFAQEQ